MSELTTGEVLGDIQKSVSGRVNIRRIDAHRLVRDYPPRPGTAPAVTVPTGDIPSERFITLQCHPTSGEWRWIGFKEGQNKLFIDIYKLSSSERLRFVLLNMLELFLSYRPDQFQTIHVILDETEENTAYIGIYAELKDGLRGPERESVGSVPGS